MPICLDKASVSYLGKIQAFIVGLMQYTADAQDSCSELALKAQPGKSNGSENGCRHVVSNFSCCIYPQQLATVSFILYDRHPEEFPDVLRNESAFYEGVGHCKCKFQV